MQTVNKKFNLKVKENDELKTNVCNTYYNNPSHVTNIKIRGD